VYVSEESHRGILPMKHSNKDGTLSAESAEGRLRLKENTFSLDTFPTQSGIMRVLRMGECADRLCFAAIYPREEPDALLKSARPDLCGGDRAGGTGQTGVPTAIANRQVCRLSVDPSVIARSLQSPCSQYAYYHTTILRLSLDAFVIIDLSRLFHRSRCQYPRQRHICFLQRSNFQFG